MELFRCKKGASKLTIIIACCLGAAIVLGGGIWGLLALRSDPVARQIELGQKYIDEGDYQRAILAFEEAIEIEPMSIEARLGLAKVYVVMGQEEEAERILLEAKDIQPERHEPIVELAKLYIEQERLEAALGLLESFTGESEAVHALIDELKTITGILLESAELTIGLDESAVLSFLITPITAAGQPVVWSSSDDRVVVVNTAGEITAVGEGEATISVSSPDGEVNDSCVVTVRALRGNTAGNIVNGGYALHHDDGWVYIAYYGGLFRMRPDISNLEKLSSESFDDAYAYLNIIGEWIYYRSWGDGGGIYRIRTDGSGREKLSEDRAAWLSVVGAWVYYINGDDGRVYRVRTDGTARERLNTVSSTNLNVVDGWAYYSSDNKVYRMKYDGSASEVLAEGTFNSLIVEDGWIYYADNHGIRRLNISNGTTQQLFGSRVSYINVTDEWIYFADYWESISRMRKDGSDRKSLSTPEVSESIIVSKGYVYSAFWWAGPRLYRTNHDGTGLEVLSEVLTGKSLSDGNGY